MTIKTLNYASDAPMYELESYQENPIVTKWRQRSAEEGRLQNHVQRNLRDIPGRIRHLHKDGVVHDDIEEAADELFGSVKE